ncbi:hypothetical protein QT982_09180 [Microcoleus sp. herbarium2]
MTHPTQTPCPDRNRSPINTIEISRSRILYIAANAAPPPGRKSTLQKVAKT